ncbi:MAG: hypothetical protein IT167_30510 [Bryobacterales bacterium]|nr:hypothetical protein [Bryobacterales bacterium]
MVRLLCLSVAAATLLITRDRQKETALGASLARDVRSRNPVIEDPMVQAYIEGLGRRLAAKMPDVELAWTFHVIRNDWGGRAREPVALPGGFLFVPAPLLGGSEGELARVLAHAMAHVAERHGLVRVERGPGTASSAVPLIYRGGSPFGLRGWRPEEEAEADRIASRITIGVEPDPGFPAVQSRVRELTRPGTMQPPRAPSLRRPGER